MQGKQKRCPQGVFEGFVIWPSLFLQIPHFGRAGGDRDAAAIGIATYCFKEMKNQIMLLTKEVTEDKLTRAEFEPELVPRLAGTGWRTTTS